MLLAEAGLSHRRASNFLACAKKVTKKARLQRFAQTAARDWTFHFEHARIGKDSDPVVYGSYRPKAVISVPRQQLVCSSDLSNMTVASDG